MKILYINQLNDDEAQFELCYLNKVQGKKESL